MVAFDHQRKSLMLILLKQIQNFVLSLNYTADNSYLLIGGKEIFKSKIDKKNVNFPTQFRLRNTSNGFSAPKSREVPLYENVCMIFQSFTVL